MKIRWSARATKDLIAIFRFIAEDDPEAASRWVEKLRQRASKAARAPRTGRWLPELPARRDIREVLLESCRIVYLERGSSIAVLTVFEGHRQLELKR